MAGFCITRVVRDWNAVEISPNGESFGSMVDAAIRNALEQGDELQTLSFELGEGDWSRMAAMYASTTATQTSTRRK